MSRRRPSEGPFTAPVGYVLKIGLVGWLLCLLSAPLFSQPQPTRNYFVYACAESEDQVALIRYGPSGLEVVKTIPVGSFPTEIEGPHGINVSPDGKYWYVTLAHGNPFGSLQKFETGSDEWVGDVKLGMYPATLDVAGSTGLLYVVNFNLHGPMEQSSVSVVETGTMLEVERIPTGIMPHGSRLNAEGTRHYSVNMMEDDLIEIDALSFKISRRLALSEHAPEARQKEMGHEMGNGKSMADKDSMGHEMNPAQMVQPTWVTTPTPQGKVYVAGNNTNVIFEIDLDKWVIARRFENTGKGPYNVGVTPDGKLLITTYKKGSAVGFWDVESGKELARVTTTRSIPHGLSITPDGEYTFVTNEGVGGEPGTVEVYHNATHSRVGAVEIGKQAGGIAFWKMEN